MCHDLYITTCCPGTAHCDLCRKLLHITLAPKKRIRTFVLIPFYHSIWFFTSNYRNICSVFFAGSATDDRCHIAMQDQP